MRAGTLDQRVTIKHKVVTRAANGEEVVSWSVLDTVWAKVKQWRGKELFAGGQMQGTVDHRVRIRYRTDVTRGMRLEWFGQPLDIVSVTEFGHREALDIMAISGARNGMRIE